MNTAPRTIFMATALIKNTSGQYLLLRRRPTSSYPEHWQFVEGKLEADESAEAALKREVQEEIAQTVTAYKKVFEHETSAVVSNISVTVHRTVFDVTLPTEAVSLSEEHTEYVWASLEEALKLPLAPGVKEVLKKISGSE